MSDKFDPAKLSAGPPPQPTNGHKTPFSPTDLVMLAVGGLTAEPLCHAGWEAVVSGEHVGRGIVAIAVGLILGSVAASFHWWRERVSEGAKQLAQRNAAWWLALAIVLFFVYAVGPDIYRRATLPPLHTLSDKTIDAEFDAIRRANPKLGNRVSMPARGSLAMAYIGKHQKAPAVVWFPPFFELFFLLDNYKVIRVADPTWSAHPPEFTRDFLRKIPKGLRPPEGGVAALWLKDPIYWEKLIGWRECSCSLYGDGLWYQLFENGRILGVLPVDAAAKYGQVFAMFNDNTWISQGTEKAEPPKCNAFAQ